MRSKMCFWFEMVTDYAPHVVHEVVDLALELAAPLVPLRAAGHVVELVVAVRRCLPPHQLVVHGPRRGVEADDEAEARRELVEHEPHGGPPWHEHPRRLRGRLAVAVEHQRPREHLVDGGGGRARGFVRHQRELVHRCRFLRLVLEGVDGGVHGGRRRQPQDLPLRSRRWRAGLFRRRQVERDEEEPHVVHQIGSAAGGGLPVDAFRRHDLLLLTVEVELTPRCRTHGGRGGGGGFPFLLASGGGGFLLSHGGLLLSPGDALGGLLLPPRGPRRRGDRSLRLPPRGLLRRGDRPLRGAPHGKHRPTRGVLGQREPWLPSLRAASPPRRPPRRRGGASGGIVVVVSGRGDSRRRTRRDAAIHREVRLPRNASVSEIILERFGVYEDN